MNLVVLDFIARMTDLLKLVMYFKWFVILIIIHLNLMVLCLKQQWFELCHQLEPVKYGIRIGKKRHEESGDVFIKLEIGVTCYTKELDMVGEWYGATSNIDGFT